jgi:hypothetical protein
MMEDAGGVKEPVSPLRFRTSDGELYDVDYRDIEEVFRRDPDGRTVPHDDPNVLMLIADDCVWLWMQGIGL